MNTNPCSTHACTIEELNATLKAALRAHGTRYDLRDIESGVLMCCETTSTHQKKGVFGGTETTISAVYVTPKWLVWANSAGGRAAEAGSVQLLQAEVHNYETTAMFAVIPNQGLNITGRYTGGNKTGITFISLESKSDGQNFRCTLDEALNNAAK